MQMLLTASSLRISSESFDTLAVANVVERSSKSIGATRVANAWICTSQVSELAVLGRVAVGIHSTLGDWKKMTKCMRNGPRMGILARWKV